MNLPRHRLPTLAILLLVAAALLHGPIAQLPNYHDFADRSSLFGIPHAWDVLSNLGFALVGLWGLSQWSAGVLRERPGRVGYLLFLVALVLTAFGSAWYHLAPDDARLVWDRLPIALACAGLLAGARGDALGRDSTVAAIWLSLAAVASVAWWYLTVLAGEGDLRPYLLLQVAPLLLLPLWQWIGGAPKVERMTFAGALVLYALARLAELGDHRIAAIAAPLTGHTLKHVLAAAAAALIVGALVASNRKTRQDPARPSKTQQDQ